jgi:hypothetical protein
VQDSADSARRLRSASAFDFVDHTQNMGRRNFFHATLTEDRKDISLKPASCAIYGAGSLSIAPLLKPATGECLQGVTAAPLLRLLLLHAAGRRTTMLHHRLILMMLLPRFGQGQRRVGA